MDKLSAAIVLLSQGVPFLQLGQDFLRTKPRRLKEGEKPNDINVFEENSYNSPDFTNAVRWDRKADYFEVFRYYKALIKLRKSSSLFRMSMKWEVEQKLSFWKKNDESFIIFSLFDDKESFVIAFNPYEDDRHFSLPDGEWYLCCDEDGGERDEPVSGTVCCPGIAAVVYKQKHS
jgi:pullulanase